METGTFPNEEVQKYMRQYFIPLKYESGRDSDQFARFSVFATPSFFILDVNGDEVYRMVGFYSPEDFITQLISALQIVSKL
jgi:thioredoxin-related protein